MRIKAHWIIINLLITMVIFTREEFNGGKDIERSLERSWEDLSEEELDEIFQPRSRDRRSHYPGTKWCGEGSSAKGYNDLGRLQDIDMCCRQHDHCNDSITASGSKYGLHNLLPFTSSHCNCDTKFRECLHKVNNFDAGLIGLLYFSVAKCFNYTHPANCIHKSSHRMPRCLEYSYNTTLKNTWQFFDVQPWNQPDSNHQQIITSGGTGNHITTKIKQAGDIVEEMNEINIAQLKGLFTPKSRSKRVIYPGTNWCGDGNNAKTYDDLGKLRELDMCCREHDHCNDSIPARGSKYGLQNPLAHTSSHCDCDLEFRKCLQTMKGINVDLVGNFYFGLAICFNYTYPADCTQRSTKSSKRCLKYLYNTTMPMEWQFFDTLPYKYVEATTTIKPTTTTAAPVSQLTSTASSVSVGFTSTMAVVTVAVFVTIVFYNKKKDSYVYSKIVNDYKLLSTSEELTL